MDKKIIVPEVSVINKLITSLHQYYPIGLNILNTDYNGYKSLLNLIDVKISQVINDSLPQNIRDLEHKLLMNFNEDKIRLDFYRQFPSYSFSIHLLSEGSKVYEHDLLITVKVSILTNYYTYYFEEITTHNNVNLLNNSRLNSLTISKDLYNYPNKKELFKIIEELINECFNAYVFVDHYLLFKLKVNNGTPHGESEGQFDNRSYPIFNFLFDLPSFNTYILTQ